MNDPADQRASDEAIKRNTNLTPTGVRQALNATAIDFQRRTDAAAAAVATTSVPKEPAKITISETTLIGQPVTLPLIDDNQNAFPKNTDGGGGGTIPDVIIVFNGTANYCILNGSVGDPV